ncbi:MAG: site-specific integrase, partial [Tannerella sp.]|nr:site-specific integrase [Tannerella sp.]
MARRKKEIVMPHLNDCGGDLSKKWYVEYSIRNPQTDNMERVRLYEEINRFQTCRERYVCARKIIENCSNQIRNGRISYQEFVEYDDLLLYDGQGSFTKKRLATAGSMKIHLSEFLQKKKTEVGEGSLRTYTSELRLFYLYLEEKGIDEKTAAYFTADIMSDFLRELVQKKQLSSVTIRKYKQTLNSFFVFLKSKKIILENPMADVSANIGVTKDEAPAAIPTYMRKMLHDRIEPADPQLWMFICFMYYTAIRPGIELRLMRLNQINYDSHTITICSTLAKNNRTETVDIPDELYKMIVNKWKLHEYNQELYVFGRNNIPGEICLGKNNMKNRFTAFRKALKLPISVKLYSWKHSGAQELADHGASIYEIQRHLRHRDITTTEMYLRKRIG